MGRALAAMPSMPSRPPPLKSGVSQAQRDPATCVSTLMTGASFVAAKLWVSENLYECKEAFLYLENTTQLSPPPGSLPDPSAALRRAACLFQDWLHLSVSPPSSAHP